MAAGLAQLRALEELDGWSRLEKLGAIFGESVRAGLRRAGRAYQFQRIGSMFCLYLTEPVRDLATAQRSDRELFAKYFHACLEAGVYFAPSQFRPASSRSHTEDDLARAGEIAGKALCAVTK